MSALPWWFQPVTATPLVVYRQEFESQGLPMALIESLGDLVQVGLRELQEVCALSNVDHGSNRISDFLTS
jgi:hypothetical protein